MAIVGTSGSGKEYHIWFYLPLHVARFLFKDIYLMMILPSICGAAYVFYLLLVPSTPLPIYPWLWLFYLLSVSVVINQDFWFHLISELL